MNKKLTLTIGIPAYNEEKALPTLLKSIVNQQSTRYDLKKIIIVSDGSTDHTIELVQQLDIQNLVIKKNNERKGKEEALVHIKKQTTTDALLLLDADVRLKDPKFIDTLIKPIYDGIAELTSANVVALPSTNFFTRMLTVSNNFKRQVYEAWNDGNNLYTCHGRAICLAKKLYSQIPYENVIADDALAYLYSQKLKLQYHYVKGAKVYYYLPKTPDDHYKQSIRFLVSQKQFSTIFEHDLITQSYKIPLSILIQTSLIFLLKNPIEMIMYIFTFTYLKIKTLNQKKFVTVWEISQTSKS